MHTDITVTSTTNSVENRSWLRGTHGTDPGSMPSIPLDYALFTGANYSDGTVKSGCVLGKVTATGKYGPYDPAASDGREVAKGFLWNSRQIPANTAQKASDALYVHGFVDPDRLPYAAGIGSLDAAGKADLTLVYFD